MEKGLAVVLKEVMEVDPMLTILTENQHPFHLDFSVNVRHLAASHHRASAS
jgi:hypothetical protein